MFNQKKQQRHQRNTTDKTFKVLCKILSGTGIKFSEEHNALYGMTHFVHVLVSMCKEGSCAHGIANMLLVRRRTLDSIPSSSWFLSRIRTMCPDTTDDVDAARKKCTKMVRAVTKHAKSKRILRMAPHIMAIDIHNIPRYGKREDTREKQLVRSRHKNGTSRFEGHATMQCVDKPNITVACTSS